MIAQAFIDQISLPLSELGVLIADLVLSALWVAGGVLLLRTKTPGLCQWIGIAFCCQHVVRRPYYLSLASTCADKRSIYTHRHRCCSNYGPDLLYPLRAAICAVLYPKDNSMT